MSLFDMRGKRHPGFGKTDAHGVPVYGRDRVCSREGCATVLSTYNPSTLCALHDAKGRQEVRQRRTTQRPAHEQTCANDSCGQRFLSHNKSRRYCSDRCRMKAFAKRRRQPDDRAPAK